MCGIAGIVNFEEDRHVQESHVHIMAEAMVHRGPDDAGVHTDGNVGFGFRRLSIIDPSPAGHQPMFNEDRSLVLVYNGEIYNFAELRESLIARGHVFRSNCDSEVVLHAYEEYGRETPNHLDGMYAFAVWDSSARRLFVARDRVGIKPFYFSTQNGRLVFASELRPLLILDPSLRCASDDGIGEHIIFRSLRDGRTLFKDIVELPPGHALQYDSQHGVQTWRYWDLPGENETSSTRVSDERQAISLLESTLRDSVQAQLVSDVPLGVQLSGGVDSSIVTALANDYFGRPLETFSIDFEEPGHGERYYFGQVAERYRTTHHSFTLSEEDFLKDHEFMTEKLAEPISLPNTVAIYHLCRHAKQRVTVMVTGEGADELLGGYWRATDVGREFRRTLPAFVPDTLTGWLNRVLLTVAERGDNWLTRGYYNHLVNSNSFLMKTFREELRMEDDYSVQRRAILNRYPGDMLSRLCYYDLHTYLPPILKRQDHASMLASVECRVPFLGNDMLALSAQLDSAVKVSGDVGKHVLKRMAEPYLSQEVLYRRKMGFGVPLAFWLRNRSVLGGYLDMLTDVTFRQRGMFDARRIEGYVNEFLGGNDRYSEMLWNLLSLELWYRKHVDAAPLPG